MTENPPPVKVIEKVEVSALLAKAGSRQSWRLLGEDILRVATFPLVVADVVFWGVSFSHAHWRDAAGGPGFALVPFAFIALSVIVPVRYGRRGKVLQSFIAALIPLIIFFEGYHFWLDKAVRCGAACEAAVR